MHLPTLTAVASILSLVSAAPHTSSASRLSRREEVPADVLAKGAYIYALNDTLNSLSSSSKSRRGEDIPRTEPVCALNSSVFPTGLTTIKVPARLTLSKVTIGHGIQNYTCQGLSDTDAPKATGALAHLYDVGCPIANHPLLLHSLTPLVQLFAPPDFNGSLNQSSVLATLLRPLTYLGGFLPGGSPTNGINSDLKRSKDVGTVGTHYFSESTPVFDLGNSGTFIGKKDDGVAAPDESVIGSVDWLRLASAGTNTTSKRIPVAEDKFDIVYRIYTAGGKAPATCKGLQSGEISVTYAAEYWFYTNSTGSS